MLKIGHRGAAGYVPENTLSSFQKAISLGVDMIEFDVRLSKDKQLVIIHDATVDRTTNGQGKVRNLTLEELKKLDAGGGEKIPTLPEVLALFKNKCQFNIELKVKNIAKPVVDLIQKENLVNRVLISSSDSTEILEVKKLNSQISTAILINFRPSFFQTLFILAQKNRAQAVNLKAEITQAKDIKFLKRKGLKVIIWTVDDPIQIKRFKKLGVDGIISNFPDRL